MKMKAIDIHICEKALGKRSLHDVMAIDHIESLMVRVNAYETYLRELSLLDDRLAEQIALLLDKYAKPIV